MTAPYAQHTPVRFFNTTTHLEIGEGYVASYNDWNDTYSIDKIVGGNTHFHVAPAANVTVRRER